MGVMLFGVGKDVDVIIFVEGVDEVDVIVVLIEMMKKEGLFE